jgi:hypothetical protein
LEKAAKLRIRRLHDDLKVRLILAVLTGNLVELKLLFVALRVDQGFIEIKNEQFVEALFFELKLNFILSCDRRKFFYLLNNIDRLDHLH